MVTAMRGSKTWESRVVVHDVGVWLPRSKTWLYSVVTRIGAPWTSWVVANRTINTHEFPFENVFSLRDRHGQLRWLVEMVLCRLGVTGFCPSLRRFALKLRPSIVHSHFGPAGWRGLDLVKAAGARHVVSFYGYDVTMVPRSPLWRARYRELFERVDAVLCEGPHMASVIEELGCPRAKLRVYHLGVDLERIPFSSPTWEKGKTLRVLMAATFTEKKGISYGLRALAKLRQQRADLSLKVTLVGGVSKARHADKEGDVIRNVIRDEGLGDIVRMPGFISHGELLDLSRSHDIFLSPSVTARNSDTEGGAPVGIIEMAAAGLIIVSTRHCDIPNVLGSGNQRLLVPERDTDSLVETLERLTRHPERWASIAEENRAHVAREFNILSQGPRLAEIYEALVS